MKLGEIFRGLSQRSFFPCSEKGDKGESVTAMVFLTHFPGRAAFSREVAAITVAESATQDKIVSLGSEWPVSLWPGGRSGQLWC